LFLFSEYIIVNMYGFAFYESISVLNILLPGVLLLTILKVLYVDLAGRGKPWIALYAMIPSLIINVVSNILLIPKYGADGSAFSSTLSYSIGSIIFLICYSKEVDIPIVKILSFQKNDFKEILLKLKRN
jgi:O-antigen/teichoic acid export membrane protein